MLKQNIKYFFRQSFRKRNKADYGEILSRGLDGESENTVYPWLYLRILGITFIIFTVYAVIVSALDATYMDRLPFYLIGGSVLDLAFIVLLFELNPKNDFSLLKLFLVMLVGGSVSAFISAFIYNFHSLEIIRNGWKLAAIAGVGEEIAKAVPSIVCIILLKKKDSPYTGFLIGAAVGTWFSLTENASFIVNSYPMYARILTALIRAMGCMFSHAMWTALISWAFCKFRKPFLNPKFYAVILACMAMHFCIDMPLWDCIPLLFAEASVCGLTALIFGIIVIYKERKAVLGAPLPREDIAPFSPLHVAKLTAVGFASAVCALLIAFAAVFTTSVKDVTVFTIEDFIGFAQDGYIFEPDKEREYDADAKNYFAQYEQCILTVAEQCEAKDGIAYIYHYQLYRNGQGDWDFDEGLRLSTVYVLLVTNGEKTTYAPQTYLISKGEELIEISYYPINDALNSGNWEYKDGLIEYYVYCEKWSWLSIAVLSAVCATAAAGTVTYIALRKKAQKGNSRTD